MDKRNYLLYMKNTTRRLKFCSIALLILLTGFGCTKDKTAYLENTNDPHGVHKTAEEKEMSAYTIHFESATEGIPINKPYTFSFSILTKDNRIVQNFDILHEKRMHVILVRKDLNTFEHLHPIFDETLSQFTFEHTFKDEGEYRIFADFVPRDGVSAVAHSAIFVGSGTGDYRALKPQKELKEQVGSYTIEYTLPHNRIVADEEIQYTLKVNEKGKPITAFEPYLGAAGHSIIIKEESLDYIHTHASAADLTFTTTFPKPGTYAIFTQFQIKGKVYTAKRVIKVGDKNTIDISDLNLNFEEAK